MQTPVAARSRLLRTSRIGFWLPRTVTTAHVSSIARPSPASLIPAPSAGRGPQRARRLGTGLAGPPITASRRRTMTALSDAVQYDQELVDIADYVHDYQVTSPLAVSSGPNSLFYDSQSFTSSPLPPIPRSLTFLPLFRGPPTTDRHRPPRPARLARLRPGRALVRGMLRPARPRGAG